MTMYRLVSDYGFGDKSWLERFMDEKTAIKMFNRQIFDRKKDYLKTMEECRRFNHPIYSIEVDHPGDKEDWDWMDS